MKRFTCLMVLFLVSPAFAVDPAPATTEDRQKFDDSLTNDDGGKVDDNPGASDRHRGGRKAGTDDNPGSHNRRRRGKNFGAEVSAEARQKKGDKKEFGKWVSEQRKQDGKRTKSEDDGSHRGRGSDDAPGTDDHGGRRNRGGSSDD